MSAEPRIDTADVEVLDAGLLEVAHSDNWPGVTITDPVERRLFARRIAVRIVQAVRESGATTLVVTSPDVGVGKSFLTRLIAPEFERIEAGRFLVVPHERLRDLKPHVREPGLVVIVDGPAMLHGDGFLDLPDDWVGAFDAAILVVMARQTDRDGLAECVGWLRASNIPPIGVVYNERLCPAPAFRMRQFAAWMKLPLGQKLRTIFSRGTA